MDATSMAFCDASSSTTSCGTLFVIRSAEELAAHVTGGEGVAAEVDFSRYSVLFASGRATNGIQQIFKTYEAQHAS